MSDISPLKDYFSAEGFSFKADVNGMDIPEASPSPEREYKALREGIAATDLSSVRMYGVEGAGAVEFLDYTFTGPVVRLREEHILHTLCISEQGEIITEAYIANIDGDRYIIMTDGGRHQAFEAFIDEHEKKFEVKIRNLNETYTMFSCDGPYSWLSMKNIFGPEILGLRYLAFCEVKDEDQTVYVMRSGKTGEYGYWIMAPKGRAGSLFEKVMNVSRRFGEHPFSLYGSKVSQLAKLENHFLNLTVEGKYTKNPYELGLFWTIQLDKEAVAASALNKMIENKITRTVIGFNVVNDQAVQEGDAVSYKEKKIGQVIGVDRSFSYDRPIGLALLEREYGYVGLTYAAGGDGALVKTQSMPFLLNKSLQVKIAG